MSGTRQLVVNEARDDKSLDKQEFKLTGKEGNKDSLSCLSSWWRSVQDRGKRRGRERMLNRSATGCNHRLLVGPDFAQLDANTPLIVGVRLSPATECPNNCVVPPCHKPLGLVMSWFAKYTAPVKWQLICTENRPNHCFFRL